MGLPLLCRPPTDIGSRTGRRQPRLNAPRRPARRWRPTAPLIIAIAASWLGAGSVSGAELDPVALLWNAPAGCPGPEAVHDQIEKSLGGSLKDLAPVAAVVNVAEPSARRWQAKLTMHSRGERTERAFEAESCDALSAAAALIIALAAEGPEAAVAGTAAASGPSRQLDGRPLPRTPALSVTSVPPPPPGWNVSGLLLQVDVALDNGTMPKNPEPGLEAMFGGAWTSALWRLRLLGGLSYFVPQDNQPNPNGDNTIGRFWLLALSARGCVTAALHQFEIGPCLGGELVAMHGSNIGGGDASSTQYWFSPLGAAVAAFTVVPGIAMFAQVEIAVPATRRTYLGASDGLSVDPIYTVPSYTVRGAAGVELRFF